MNCQQVHCSFASPLLLGRTIPGPELSEHLADCPECKQLLETQKELAVNLRLASQSAPEVPASLDRAVLGQYREFMAQRHASSRTVIRAKRTGPLSLLAWAAAVTAAFLVAEQEMALLFPANTILVGERAPVGQRASPPATRNTGTSGPMLAARHPTKKGVSSTHGWHNPAMSSASQPDTVSPAFNTLLYCDVISCGGAMQVIRLELPSSMFRSSAMPEANVVSADVLVGSDGIARAIRIVE
jgi:hypothetical protein